MATPEEKKRAAQLPSAPYRAGQAANAFISNIRNARAQDPLRSMGASARASKKAGQIAGDVTAFGRGVADLGRGLVGAEPQQALMRPAEAQTRPLSAPEIEPQLPSQLLGPPQPQQGSTAAAVSMLKSPDFRTNKELLDKQQAGISGRGTTLNTRPKRNTGAPEGSIVLMKGTKVYYTDPDEPSILLPAIPGASLEELREAKALQDAGYADSQQNKLQAGENQSNRIAADAAMTRARAGSAQQRVLEDGRTVLEAPNIGGDFENVGRAVPAEIDEPQIEKIGPIGAEKTVAVWPDGSTQVIDAQVRKSLVNDKAARLIAGGMNSAEALQQAEKDVDKMMGE